MQTKATLMVLVLLSGTIAGCTSDPDGGGNDGIDSDALDDLFDQYFEDFVNNTSITVNNHYYNNSTYVVDDGDYSSTSTTNIEYNNTTNVDGGEINNYNNQTENDYSSSSLNYSLNSSGDDSVIQAFRIVWNPDEHVSPTDFGSREVVINGTVQVPGWTGSELSYQYNGNLIKLTLTCEEIINAAYYMQSEDWREWIFDEYGGSWSQADSLGHSIESDISEVVWSDDGVRHLCWRPNDSQPPTADDSGSFHSNEYDREDHNYTVFEISLSAGQAITLLSIPSLDSVSLECDDGFSTSSNNGTFYDTAFIGGHTECTVSGNAVIETAFSYVWTPISNGSGPSIQTPEWFDGGYWYVFTHVDNWSSFSYFPYSSTPSEFLVYFTMHIVQVYDHDSE